MLQRRKFLVGDKVSGGLFAMKALRKTEVVRRKQVEHTKLEREIMGSAAARAHPFINSLTYAFATADKLYMLSEYCGGGELYFHMQQSPERRFPPNRARFYAAEISCA